MPPNAHALLSASSAHRWLSCPPSARLEQEFADNESEAAAEGTAAHALCEHKLRRALKLRSKKPVSKYDNDEMDGYTDDYVQFVLERIEEAKQYCPDPTVLIEQKLDFSCYVPEGFGTGDCLIVSDEILHIIDFKYGQGVLVDAVENPQMMLYAIGALRLFDCLYNITTVHLTIFQPRRENISTWMVSVDELMEWAEKTLNREGAERLCSSLQKSHRGVAAIFYAHFWEVKKIRKLKKYKPSKFKAKTSHYDKEAADYAVAILCL